MIYLLFLVIGIAGVIAGYFIEAAIYVDKEQKREKEHDLSLKNHNWKNFKNKQ